MTHPDAAYWDKGAEHVPTMTGAAAVLDGRDLRAACADLEIDLPLCNVADVGCGSGRLAALVDDGYVGFDITQSAVDYCQARHRTAYRVSGADDPLWGSLRGAFTWVTAISLLTHVGTAERRAYLALFARLAPSLLVDIIPGEVDGGSTQLWTVPPDVFEADLEQAGYAMCGIAEGEAHHRFYRAERV